MKSNNFQPEMIIVGEPTEMEIVTSHKGGDEMRTEITGFEVHSSNPPRGVNAISTAVKLITRTDVIILNIFLFIKPPLNKKYIK